MAVISESFSLEEQEGCYMISSSYRYVGSVGQLLRSTFYATTLPM